MYSVSILCSDSLSMTGGNELYSLSTLHAPEILFLLVVHSIEIQAQLILFSDIQTIYAATGCSQVYKDVLYESCKL